MSDRLADNLRIGLYAFLIGVSRERSVESRIAAELLDNHKGGRTIDRLAQQLVCIAADPELGAGASAEFADLAIRDDTSPGFDRVSKWMRERRGTILDCAKQMLGQSHITQS